MGSIFFIIPHNTPGLWKKTDPLSPTTTTLSQPSLAVRMAEIDNSTETLLSEILSAKYTVFLRVINIQREKKSLHHQNKSDFSAALSALLVTPPGSFRHWRSCSLASPRHLLEGASVKRIELLPLLFLFYIFLLPFYLLPL